MHQTLPKVNVNILRLLSSEPVINTPFVYIMDLTKSLCPESIEKK